MKTKEFLIPSELVQVPKKSASVLSFFKPLALDAAVLFDVRLCLEEAIANAVKYGNRLKKNLPVHVRASFDRKKITLRVEDQGRGFDPKALSDCTSTQNRLKCGGRGVYLICQLMDEVHYNPQGNSLLMVKYLKK